MSWTGYEHLTGPVAANPYRLGKALDVPFEDVLSTRRGDYRALYTELRRFWPTVLGMPAGKLPTPQDAAAARRMLLDGLARDADILELVSELAPLHPRNNTFPGEVFLCLAADALEWCGASREEPLAPEGLQERFLSECAFRGRQNHKLQFAVLAAAALRGGAEPDLLDGVAWWQGDDFWQYALFAAIAYIRAAANRASMPVRQACQQLAEGPGCPAS